MIHVPSETNLKIQFDIETQSPPFNKSKKVGGVNWHANSLYVYDFDENIKVFFYHE